MAKKKVEAHMTDDEKDYMLAHVERMDRYMKDPKIFKRSPAMGKALDYWIRCRNILVSGNEDIAARLD